MIKEIPVTLEDILAARENRRERQKTFQNRHGGTLVSVTLNMPGAVKDSAVLRKLLDYAVWEIKKSLTVAAEERIYSFTGPEALLAVAAVPEYAKNICVRIEEDKPFGRLLDLDVFTAAGEPLSRAEQGGSAGRGCFVCGRPAVECRRNQSHSSAETLSAARRLLVMFQAHATRNIGKTAETIGALAVEAMLFEASATPSPGLVDRVNSGAHQDMDFFTFMSSSAALATTMARCAQAGCDHEGDLPELLPVLRHIGLEGEKSMLTATGGVNTQKGLLFSLGIAAAVAGWLAEGGKSIAAHTVLDAVAVITAGIVERELARRPDENNTAKPTAGEKLYREHGVTGIRGEMEQGLPSVRGHGLPALKKSLADGLSVNDALINTLLVLMSHVDDTTVMNRCGLEKMRVWVKKKAAAALLAGGMGSAGGREMIASLDDEFITGNVSPGGSADLLAVAWFLHKIGLTPIRRQVDKGDEPCLKT